MKLQTKDASDNSPVTSIRKFDGADLYEEVEEMISTMQDVVEDTPDIMIKTSMALMARCTEIWIQLLRVEQVDRRAKAFRTLQLQKIMELIDFEYKGASRLIEVARQEVDLSR